MARQIVGTTVAGWLYFTETGEFWRVSVDEEGVKARNGNVTEKIKTDTIC